MCQILNTLLAMLLWANVCSLHLSTRIELPAFGAVAGNANKRMDKHVAKEDPMPAPSAGKRPMRAKGDDADVKDIVSKMSGKSDAWRKWWNPRHVPMKEADAFHDRYRAFARDSSKRRIRRQIIVIQERSRETRSDRRRDLFQREARRRDCESQRLCKFKAWNQANYNFAEFDMYYLNKKNRKASSLWDLHARKLFFNECERRFQCPGYRRAVKRVQAFRRKGTKKQLGYISAIGK